MLEQPSLWLQTLTEENTSARIGDFEGSLLPQETIDHLLLEYKLELLYLIPQINDLHSVSEVFAFFWALKEKGIPLEKFLTDNHKEQLEWIFYWINHWDLESIIWNNGESVINKLISTSTSNKELNLLSELPDEVMSLINEWKTKIEIVLSSLSREIETILTELLRKVDHIIAYKIADQKAIIAHKESLTDKLWINNSKAFFIDIAGEFDKIKENPEENPLSLILFDLDRFKSVNDKFGHLWWDLVLQSIADILGSFIESEWWEIYRYWWEEFVVIMPNKTKKEAKEILKLIINRVWSLDFRDNSDDTSYEITLSAWISCFCKRWQYPKYWKLVEAADKNSYKAKSNWRARFNSEDDNEETMDVITNDLFHNKETLDDRKIIKWLSDKIVRFFGTLMVQKGKIQKVNDNNVRQENISSIWVIDNSYRQIAYFLDTIFKEYWYWDFEWVEERLENFIWETYIEPWENWRFSDVYRFLNNRESIVEIKTIIGNHEMANMCPWIIHLLKALNSLSND